MKSLTAYLAAAGLTGDAAGPAAAALQALLTDAQGEIGAAQAAAQQAREQVQSEIRENQQARALAGAFRKVAEKASVDLSGLSDTTLSAERRRELSDAASQQVLDHVATAGGEAADASRILADAGFDLDAYRKAGKEKRAELAAQFAEGVKADRVKLRETERAELLREAGLDPRKAGALLGDLALEKGKVTVTENGQTVEKDALGLRAPDGTFRSVDDLLQEKGFSAAELAPNRAPITAEPASPLWLPQPGPNDIRATTAVTDADADRLRVQSGQYSPF